MICLTRLDRNGIVLNADLIESIEETPDTVISMTTGKRITVLETAAEVVKLAILYRRAIAAGPAYSGARTE